MIIYGKEYHFALTIWAQQQIAKLCPNGDIKRFNELFGGENLCAGDLDTVAKICVIMSEAYETKQTFLDLEYSRHPLTMEVVQSLEMDEFEQLVNEAIVSYMHDETPTVKTEPQKKTDAADPESGSTQAGISTTDAVSA